MIFVFLEKLDIEQLEEFVVTLMTLSRQGDNCSFKWGLSSIQQLPFFRHLLLVH